MPLFDPVKGLAVKLADGTTWAARDKLDEPRRLVRERFGGTILFLDFNRDGKTDILLHSSVLRAGKPGDLLLRNDGNNVFSDATKEAGLATHASSVGGAVGDFDNDGFADLALAGTEGMKLFRNNAGKGFEDKTAAVGLDKEKGAFLTASWVDLDQDGDIDLVLARYAADVPHAVRHLRVRRVKTAGSLWCMRMWAWPHRPTPASRRRRSPPPSSPSPNRRRSSSRPRWAASSPPMWMATLTSIFSC
jgi:hypothetical protein